MASNDSAKREEMKTYQALALGRDFKSKAQRQRTEKKGLYRVIGGGTKPHLKVSAQRYEIVRLEIMKAMLQEAQGLGLSKEDVFRCIASRVEEKVYAQLAAEQQQAARLEAAFIQQYGRHPTVAERDQLRQTLPLRPTPTTPTFQPYRTSLVDEILTKVQQRQVHNPAHYRTAWVEAVGAEWAQQSTLEKIDKVNGVAYFRCLNSTLSFQIQRQPQLPQKLTKRLGFLIRQIRVLY